MTNMCVCIQTKQRYYMIFDEKKLDLYHQDSILRTCHGTIVTELHSPTTTNIPFVYTAKNTTDFSSKLSISPACCNLSKLQRTCQFHQLSWNKSVKIRLAATCHLQTFADNLLKQLAARLWITSFNNQVETSLLSTATDLSSTSCRKSMQLRVLILACSVSLYKMSEDRLFATCVFLAVYLCILLQILVFDKFIYFSMIHVLGGQVYTHDSINCSAFFLNILYSE